MKTHAETKNSELKQLHQEIDHRVQGIRENRPDWLCGKGCDSCCKKLAEIPQLTATEWDLLRSGLASLTSEKLSDIGDKLDRLSRQTSRPLTCPLLDEASGACPVYLQRPVACRTYGFYVQRDLGLYCGDIESRVANGKLADVVWGNHDAIDRRLSGLGDSRPLTEWFAAWRKAAS